MRSLVARWLNLPGFRNLAGLGSLVVISELKDPAFIGKTWQVCFHNVTSELKQTLSLHLIFHSNQGGRSIILSRFRWSHRSSLR